MLNFFGYYFAFSSENDKYVAFLSFFKTLVRFLRRFELRVLEVIYALPIFNIVISLSGLMHPFFIYVLLSSGFVFASTFVMVLFQLK